MSTINEWIEAEISDINGQFKQGDKDQYLPGYGYLIGRRSALTDSQARLGDEDLLQWVNAEIDRLEPETNDEEATGMYYGFVEVRGRLEQGDQ